MAASLRQAVMGCGYVVILALGANMACAQREGPVRVLVDQTREYSEEWMALGDVLPPEQFLVTQSFASVSGQPLDPFDILVVRYDQSDTVWSAPMTELVKRFVRTGGGLLLIAHGGHWYMGPRESAQYPIYQANRLAAAFDFRFEIDVDKLEVRSPLVLRAPEATQGITEGITEYAAADAPGGLADVTGSAIPVVASTSGELVIAARGYGRGRVVACSDPNGLNPGGPNEALLRRIMTWLSPTEPRPVTDPPPRLVLPEVTHRFRGVGVAIPAELTSGAQLLAFELALKDVGDAMEKTIGVESWGSYIVLVLPPGTPPLVPGAFIAHGATHNDLYPVLEAAARAIASSCFSPRQLPGMFQAAWEHYWAIKVLGGLGYTRASVAWQELTDRFRAIDADRLVTLDPLVVPEDPEVRLDALARTVFLIEGMASEFGEGFWKALAHRNRVGGLLRDFSPLSPEEFGDLVQAVGRYQARAWLRERGVGIPDESRPYGP